MTTKRAASELAGAVVFVALTTVRAEKDAPPHVAIASSSIASVSFRKENASLEIAFHSGAIYRYHGVPKKIYLQMLRAESKGRFFASRVRGKFPFERVEEPKL